ncbi:Asp-tRNA(Asn)/Glu-tRNA(Gln) amidotransferase subunit GatB [Cryomorphaceae bacterium 1068]|nr:Asp-tRNA(Asn)/Glu-tRNA(Gln) amidotransferase subunit GatB [Cryomorphaceae bacterium 1068]
MIEERIEILEKYQLVVGLEVHAQLLTKSKAYAGDLNSYGSLPNSNTSPLTLGHPGTLPRVNKKVIEYAIKLGLATNCSITRAMHFARKNYFYADLPKGYQITQDTTPICTDGFLDVKDANNDIKRIGITRIHIEEDAGKSIHDQDPFNTLVDLNRAGVPLLEIVSEPDIRSIEEAYNYLAEIRRLVRYLEVCDGNMEEGSMRCDANVSVMLRGSKKFGNRCEVKNMNSLRNVQRAIEFEMKRQIEILENGGEIIQQTRSFDAVQGTTFALRGKEDAHDYRYFPEPDIQPLTLEQSDIDKVKEHMPPLPNELFRKYINELQLSEYDAGILIESKPIALYFNDLIGHTKNYKAAANWVIGEIKSHLNQSATAIEEFPLKPAQIAEIIALIDSDKISNSAASQQLFPKFIEQSNKTAAEIAESENLLQESDDDSLEVLAKQAIAAFPDKAAAYKNGNKGLLGLFMGEVMKLSNRKANPKMASEILRKLLEK